MVRRHLGPYKIKKMKKGQKGKGKKATGKKKWQERDFEEKKKIIIASFSYYFENGIIQCISSVLVYVHCKILDGFKIKNYLMSIFTTTFLCLMIHLRK